MTKTGRKTEKRPEARMEYRRKRKEAVPVMALCYDFDKTLTPDDMQAQGYIQSVGYDVKQFWEETDRLAHAPTGGSAAF